MRASVNGILLLDKPLGISSNHALQRAKRLLNAKKAGHTGSLDPLASGMLPICLGEATKYSRFFLEADKCYQFTMRLGITTTTGDTEGEILSTQAVDPLVRHKIDEIILHFQGQHAQIPPMFSAIKQQGRALYHLAREGKVVPRTPRLITIHELVFKEDLSCFQDDTLTFIVKCSKGTYVRSLAEDIGQYLGCGAHVIALRRLWGEPFRTYPMVTLEALASCSPESLGSHLLSIEEILTKILPVQRVSPESAHQLYQGKIVTVPAFNNPGLVILVTSEEKFIGIGEIFEDQRLVSRRLLSQEITDFA